ncbi:hypothetical protein MMC26_004319 [Xylographa opegraphella]|nr:hypothetical protein [Xylographa opegraphella]
MDGASGAIAFASIAIQLGQSFVALSRYWESIKEAPADILTIAQDLRFLADTVHHFELDEQNYGQAPEVSNVLKSCMAKVVILQSLVEEIEPGFSSKHRLQRKWSALKAVLKNDKVEKFRKSLEESKTTLLLAQSISQRRLQSVHSQSLEEKLSSIVSTLGKVQFQYCSRIVTTTSTEHCDGDEQWNTLRDELKRLASEMSNPFYRAGFEHAMDCSLRQIIDNNSTTDLRSNFEGEKVRDEHTAHYEPLYGGHHKQYQRIDGYISTNENIFGEVVVQSPTYLKQSRNDPDNSWESRRVYEHKMNIRIKPAWWLVKIGFNRGIEIAFSQATAQGLKISLSPIRLVPDDALIFDFCYTGNIDGVRRLLMRGEASARDTNSWGCTPLHPAVWGCHAELSRLLIDAGADTAAVWASRNYASWTPLVLAACADDYDHYGQKIDILRLFSDQLDEVDESDFLVTLFQSGTCESRDLDRDPLINWALSYYSSIFSCNLERLLDAFVHLHPTAQKLLADRYISLRDFETQSHTIFTAVASGMTSTIQILLNIGLNPHNEVSYQGDPPDTDTLTSVAMWNSRAFDVWRIELKTLGTNFEAFVQEEMEISLIKAMGWTTKSLLVLFNQEIRATDFPRFECSACSSFHALFEPAWRIKLDNIRGTKGM